MCGRYTLKSPAFELAKRFRVPLPAVEELALRPRYNIAPTQWLPIIVAGERAGEHEVKLARWGLIPRWAKDKPIALINARAETVSEKASFREAFQKRRCLVPSDGFYEWNASKIPHYIRPQGVEGLFAFAGIWESSADAKTGEVVDTFALLTSESSGELRALHDRRPVILRPEAEEEWVGSSIPDLHRIQASESYTTFEFYAVSKAVGRPQNDDPSLIERNSAI